MGQPLLKYRPFYLQPFSDLNTAKTAILSFCLKFWSDDDIITDTDAKPCGIIRRGCDTITLGGSTRSRGILRK